MSTIMTQTATEHESRFNLRNLSLVLLLIGLVITAYLSYTHLSESNVVCVGDSSTFDCDAVNNSVYSKFLGIYVAYLGFAADLFLFAIVLLEPRIPFLRTYGIMIVFAVVLLGWLYHDYLTFVSIQYIQKFCIWCLTEHAVMTILLIVTSIRLYRQLFTAPAEV